MRHRGARAVSGRRLDRHRPPGYDRERCPLGPSRGRTDRMNSIVVHYNELALKGRNRPWFVQMLVRNIRTALAGLSVPAVRSVMGRIQIELGPATWDSARERLQSVFGIQYFSYAGIAPLDLDQMASTILGDLG